MLQEIDSQQRLYAARKKEVEEELKGLSPSFERIQRAVLVAVDSEELENAQISNTPEELHEQTRLLLEQKGKLTPKPRGSISVIRPGDRSALSLPLGLKVEIGGREVSLYLKEPFYIEPGTQEPMNYSLGMGLKVGDDYYSSYDGITIGKTRVKGWGEEVLNQPENIQRVSKILIKAERALS